VTQTQYYVGLISGTSVDGSAIKAPVQELALLRQQTRIALAE